MPKLAAFDVDLHRVHGFSNEGGRICYNAPDWPFEQIATFDRILVEVASPVATGDSSAEAYNRRKWAIGNSIMVGRLLQWASTNYDLSKIYVSSADRWTLKHAEKVREAAAGCLGQDNHDIRACRCMLFYYSTNPVEWKPLMDYYQGLSDKKKKETDESSDSTSRRSAGTRRRA